MTFATDMQAAALDLLTDFGQSLTFTRYSSNAYNPSTGGVDPVTSTTYTGYGHPSSYSSDEIDGTMIQVNDIKLLLYTTTTPDIQDSVTIDSNLYRVENVEFVKAQGSNIYYKLQLRK